MAFGNKWDYSKEKGLVLREGIRDQLAPGIEYGYKGQEYTVLEYCEHEWVQDDWGNWVPVVKYRLKEIVAQPKVGSPRRHGKAGAHMVVFVRDVTGFLDKFEVWPGMKKGKTFDG